jgi:hypothetical protein
MVTLKAESIGLSDGLKMLISPRQNFEMLFFLPGQCHVGQSVAQFLPTEMDIYPSMIEKVTGESLHTEIIPPPLAPRPFAYAFT